MLPFSEEGTAYLRQLYPETEIESLYKSYRSNYEIMEFDRVLIPDADDGNYSSECEKGLLHVACTRAMHRLSLLYTGAKSRLITRW